MSQGFKKGERVKHATKTEWGIGEVLADEAGGNVKIFFEDVGAKSFDVARANFLSLSGDAAASDYLSALVKHHHSESMNPAGGSKKRLDFKPFPDAVVHFLGYFPAGFRDPAYLDGPLNERSYKLEAHRLMVELLGREVFESLLRQNSYAEISSRAKRVVGKTNLISPYEKMWLTDGLSATASQERFACTLYELLYGAGDAATRFEAHAKMLGDIGAAKWPIATYFPFIALPSEHMFLKPVVTQEAAKVLGQEINYRPELNWLTYSQVLALAERIRKELLRDGREDLQPRDMIDVQSFIWVTAPGYFQ